jgi:hypothetical protein
LNICSYLDIVQVFALGSGLAQTGVGAVTGLADTAKSPFAGGTKAADLTSSQHSPEGGLKATAPKKGPRKIEVRNGQKVESVEQDGMESYAEAVSEA